MDPVRNPYSPGAGTPPPALVGRDQLIEEFGIAIRRMQIGRPARSMMLTGLRGVGKTVLLREFGKVGSGLNWTHLHLEASEDDQFLDSVAAFARQALLRLSRRHELADRVRQALGVLRSFQVRWNIPDAGSVDLQIDPIPGYADSGALELDLADLLSEVGQLAATQQSGVLFTVDEMQYLPREHFAALIVALHRISQEELPLMLVGAGLPSLPALAGEAKSYAERLFVFRQIDQLSPQDAQFALTLPAQREQVAWEPEALDLVVEQTQGYPYFLQEFAQQAWDAAEHDEVINRSDVEVATPIAVDDLDTGFFAVRFDRTTPAERDYLAAMSSLGPGPYGSGDVARALSKTTTQLGPVRDSLIRRGLCYSPRWGVIGFTVPMFDQFLRRRLG